MASTLQAQEGDHVLNGRLRARREFLFLQAVHVAVLATANSEASPLVLGISGLVNTVTYGRLLLAEFKLSRVQLHPFWFYLLSGFVRRGPATCWAAAAVASGYSLRLGPVPVNAHLLDGQLLLVLGDLLFVLGFTIADSALHGRGLGAVPTSPARLESTAWCMLGIGWALKALLAAGLPLHNLGNAVSIVVEFASPAGAYLLYVYAVSGRSRSATPYYAIFAAVVAVELLFSLSSYMKSPTLILLTAVFLCAVFTALRRRAGGRTFLPAKTLVLGGAVVVFVVFVLFPYSKIRRAEFWVGSARRENVAVWPAMSRALAAAVPGTEEFAAMHRFPYDGAWAVLTRHADVQEGAWIAFYVSRNGTAEGMFFRDAVVNLYPRALWPDKPLYWPGRKIAVMLGQATSVEHATTSTAAGGIACSGYLNFTWAGLLLFSVASGAAFAFVGTIAHRQLHNSPIAAVVYMSVTVDAAMHFENVMDGGLTTFVYYGIVFLPAIYLSQRLFMKRSDYDRQQVDLVSPFIRHRS